MTDAPCVVDLSTSFSPSFDVAVDCNDDVVFVVSISVLLLPPPAAEAVTAGGPPAVATVDDWSSC